MRRGYSFEIGEVIVNCKFNIFMTMINDVGVPHMAKAFRFAIVGTGEIAAFYMD